MRAKTQIRMVAVVVSFVWSIAIALNGLQVSGITSKLLGFLPLALVVVYTAFDQFLWHLKLFLTVAKCPDLRGTWMGHFNGQWIDDDGVIQHTIGDAALIIKQNFTSISVVLVAEKSKSYSCLSHIRQHASGDFTVSYEYSNTPALASRDDMPAHSGSTNLSMSTARPKKLTGEYWTNRLSRGTIEMTWLAKGRVADLDEARRIVPQNDKART